MAATTQQSAEPLPGTRLVRFDAAERVAHWATAALFLSLTVTGAFLYVPALVALVGQRALVERLHVDCGLALPLPLVVSLAGSWGRGLRTDLRRLNRWTAEDRQWLALVLRREPVAGASVGKFNPGQKLNAAFTGGVVVVMLMTGCIMRWAYFWPLSFRTGATFVHDLVAYCFVAVALAHISMALAHPAALRSMVTGVVNRAWANKHAALWAAEIGAPARPPAEPAARAGEPMPSTGEPATGSKRVG
ncbi:MAG: cytochrome b/b6 domain-containing protein [Acidimicrobiales bacterium]